MKLNKPLKDLPFVYRYPRTSVVVLTGAGLLAFFSRPIFDVFFNDNIIDPEEFIRTHKPRFGRFRE